MGSTVTKAKGKRERGTKATRTRNPKPEAAEREQQPAAPVGFASTPIGFEVVPPSDAPSHDHYHTIDWRMLNDAVVHKGQCVRIGPTPTDSGSRYQWELETADHLGMQNVAMIFADDYVYIVPRRPVPGADIVWWPDGYYD